MKKIKPGDIAVIVFFILLAVVSALVLWNGDNNKKTERLIARISINGENFTSVDLNSINEAYYIYPTEGVSILVENGRIKFAESDCKDKICVLKGWLDSKGDCAICAPNMCIISIEGGDIDAIAG